jgi:type IV fimbrial biogenesis protein FimT
MLTQRARRGFSLIELMVTLTIAGILLAVAMPSFSTWMTNIRIRNVATEFYTGLQQARSEAIARNTQVRFQSVTTMDSSCSLSTSGAGWVVNVVNGTNTVDSKCNVAPDPATTTAPLIIANRRPDTNTSVAVSATASQVVFTNLGRQPTSPAPTDLTYNFTASSSGGCQSAGGNLTCLRVLVTTGGQIRMCNPRFDPSTGDPQAC